MIRFGSSVFIEIIWAESFTLFGISGMKRVRASIFADGLQGAGKHYMSEAERVCFSVIYSHCIPSCSTNPKFGHTVTTVQHECLLAGDPAELDECSRQ